MRLCQGDNDEIVMVMSTMHRRGIYRGEKIVATVLEERW